MVGVGPLPIIHGIGARIQPAAFLKAGLSDAVDFDHEIKATIWISARPRCHEKFSFLLNDGLVSGDPIV
jgi:hypothetical protein